MLELFVERQTRTVRGNQVLIALRLLLATVSLAVLLIEEVHTVAARPGIGPVPPPPLPDPFYYRPPGIVALIVCVLTILYLIIARRLRADGQKLETAAASSQSPASAVRPAAQLALLQVFVDIFLISALVWHTGGVESQFVVLYLISICAAAFVLKWNVALLGAALATTLFGAVAALYSFGVIPESFRIQATSEQLRNLQHLGILGFFRLLLLPACAFFLTAALAGTLSRRLAMAKLLHDEILEGIGEGLVVLDSQRKALYHNGEFLRLLGLDRPGARAAVPASPEQPPLPPPNGPALKALGSRLKGTSLHELLGTAIDQHAQEVLKDRTPRRIEANHRRADGRIVPFAIRIIPMMDPDNESVRGLIVAVDDITAEKKIEEFLKHRQRIETMGHISATIAHEIRNPLASIRGAVQEIGRSVAIPEDKKVLLEIVLSESDRLDQIINDFLRFARMRPPKLVPTDIGRVLADVKLLICARPESKEVQVTLSGDEGEPFPADPEQMRQLFLNLGLNALQALNGAARKELALRVAVVSRHRALGFPPDQSLDRPGVQVSISDTGGGIPADVRARIFEPFFTTKATGTGLGLAIVERIVQGHEGLVMYESRESAGTTFRVWLPTNLAANPAHLSGFRPVVAEGVPGRTDGAPASPARPKSARLRP